VSKPFIFETKLDILTTKTDNPLGKTIVTIPGLIPGRDADHVIF